MDSPAPRNGGGAQTKTGVPAARRPAEVAAAARAAFATGRTRPLRWRADQLDGLIRALSNSVSEIQEAMRHDLGKSATEAYLTEIGPVIAEAKLLKKNLSRWTKNRRVQAPITLGTSRAWIQREPLGTVLIIGPWNYPFHLLLVPLAGALAAGNSVVLKPSEIAPATSRLLSKLIPRYLDPDAVKIVEGGVQETTELLDLPWDHIFYTGNGAVGSIVMAAAAKHLSPVTLELGGKSPVWVDESFPIEQAAQTLAWAKYANCGQTCVAPDYVLATRDVATRLARELERSIAGYYGSDPRTSPDYSRIVNERHARRLASLLGAGTTVVGGTFDIADRYVSPTVLLDVPMNAPVMMDEIFGPILPIVVVHDHHQAIEFIRQRPKPLALYVFTNRSPVRDDILAKTSSGGVALNTAMLQLGVSTLPFGGVGASGTGSYHGEQSIKTFSHERSVLRKLPGPDLTKLARPPFNARKSKMLTGQ